MMRKGIARSLTLTAALLMAACSTQNRTPLQPGADAFPQPHGYNMFSPEQEVQVGKQAAAQADAEMPELPARDPISDYVSTLGQKLARQLPDNPYIFDFKVVNQKEINAFALPGGPVRVNLGTIQAADNEGQLAGVIAHEISHVYMRHATANASKQQMLSIPAAILGTVLGGGAGGQLARLGLEFGVSSAFLKYSRDAESEADRVGAKIMYEAGYNPQDMVRFFEKLKEEGGSGGPQFLSDHPDPGNRAEAVSQETAQLPAKRFTTNTPAFSDIKQIASKMKPYTADQIAKMAQDKRGSIGQVSQDSIKPSGDFQTLNGGAFQIAYPSNWKTFGDSNSAVTIAPEAGVSQNAIAYGVVISGYQPQQQQSLEQSAQAIVEALRQSNPQVQTDGNLQHTSVNGQPAVAINLAGPSPLSDGNGNAATERDQLVALQRSDGTVLWMLFIAPERDFSALRPTFQKMLQSLRVG
jgi:hypothetical protein